MTDTVGINLASQLNNFFMLTLLIKRLESKYKAKSSLSELLFRWWFSLATWKCDSSKENDRIPLWFSFAYIASVMFHLADLFLKYTKVQVFPGRYLPWRSETNNLGDRKRRHKTGTCRFWNSLVLKSIFAIELGKKTLTRKKKASKKNPTKQLNKT